VFFVLQTSGLSAEVTASSSADLAEIEQIVKDRMVNFESEHFHLDWIYYIDYIDKLSYFLVFGVMCVCAIAVITYFIVHGLSFSFRFFVISA